MSSPFHPDFKRAVLRGVTAACPVTLDMGISFDLQSGGTLRFLLDEESAQRPAPGKTVIARGGD